MIFHIYVLTDAHFSWRTAPGALWVCSRSWDMEKRSSSAIICWTSREIIPSQDPSIPPSQTPILPWDESLPRGISLPSWWQEPRMTDGRTGNVWIQGHGPTPPKTFRVKRWIFKSWTNLRRQRVFNQHRINRIGFSSNPWAVWKCQLNLIRVFILLNQPSRACVAFCGTLPAAWEQTHNKLSKIPLELLTKV